MTNVPTKPIRNRRAAALQLRISEAERHVIGQAAEATGQSVSAFVRGTALDVALKVLEAGAKTERGGSR